MKVTAGSAYTDLQIGWTGELATPCPDQTPEAWYLMARAYRPLPAQRRLAELLDYNPESGELLWRDGSSAYRMRVTQNPRTGHKYTWVSVYFEGTTYVASRLIWKLMTGEDPGTLVIDHIDRDSSNNRWSNLRATTLAVNAQNKEFNLQARYTPYGERLPAGIYYVERDRNVPYKACVHIPVQLRTTAIGRVSQGFASAAEAIAWRTQMLIKLHGPTYVTHTIEDQPNATNSRKQQFDRNCA